MSKLIDEIRNGICIECEINGKWYIAKPIPNSTLRSKLKDCIKILTNKAIAVHYKEDE